jgi:hypothetical protein
MIDNWKDEYKAAWVKARDAAYVADEAAWVACDTGTAEAYDTAATASFWSREAAHEVTMMAGHIADEIGKGLK